MSDKKISELTELTAPDGTEELVVNDSGTSKKITQANLFKLGDNVKAKFGAGDDLQIYHDGSHSYIQDVGTGNLSIQANAAINLKKYTGETLATFAADGAVSLYYDNSAKLATTATGVDVTGSVTCDGFTSTGIDDNATSTAITINASENVNFAGELTITKALAQMKLDGDNFGAMFQKNAYITSLLGGAYHDGTNYVYGVTGRGASMIDLEHDSSSNQSVRIKTASAGTAGATISWAYGSIEASAFTVSSDYRLKENIVPMALSIDRLMKLKPVKFNFIDANHMEYGKATVDGFIAHEVQALIPEAVRGEKDAVDDRGEPSYQGIDQSKLVPLLVASLQEAVAKIESLEARVTALEV